MLFQGRVGISQVLGHCPLFGLLWSALELSCCKGEWILVLQGRYNRLRYADDTTLMAESEEELNSLLMKGKRGE